MTNLYPILSRLGLAQYVGKFSEEGFENWETVLDITESDLYDRIYITSAIHTCILIGGIRDALGVKLGHRRVSSCRMNAHLRWEYLAAIELNLIQILQREIAQTRGVSLEQLNPSFRSSNHEDRNEGDESRVDGRGAAGTGGKRKYRRHPKVSSFLLQCGHVACVFDFPSIGLTICATIRPMRMRLKGRHLPMLSSQTVSVVIGLLKIPTDGH